MVDAEIEITHMTMTAFTKHLWHTFHGQILWSPFWCLMCVYRITVSSKI